MVNGPDSLLVNGANGYMVNRPKIVNWPKNKLEIGTKIIGKRT